MPPSEIDLTDMAILYLLQENARGNTTEAIAEQIGVSSTTVSTRIRKMEDEGVIQGYNPTIDYLRAGFDHHYVMMCTAPFDAFEEAAAAVAENVNGVVKVRKFLTTSYNMSVEIVAFDRRGFEESLRELDELGVEIERFELVDSEETRPFNHFGQALLDE